MCGCSRAAEVTNDERLIDNEVIEGSIGITRKPVNDPDLSYCRDKAMCILIVSIKDDLVTEISEFEDPRDAWNHLQKSYEVCDVTRKLHLKSRLMNLRVSEDGGIEQYLREFKMIRSQLISTGQQLPKEDVVEIFLNALPNSYESFITALNGSGELPPLDVLVGRIQHMESRRALKYNNKGNEEALFVQTKRFFKPLSENRSLVVTCHYCGKQDHYLNQCRERESDIKKLDDDSRSKFLKHSVNMSKDSLSETLEQESHDTHELFDVAMATLDSNHDSKWYIDSVASTHITGRSEFFDTLKRGHLVAHLFVQLVVKFTLSVDWAIL